MKASDSCHVGVITRPGEIHQLVLPDIQETQTTYQNVCHPSAYTPDHKPEASWGFHSNDTQLLKALELRKCLDSSEDVRAMGLSEYVETVLRMFVDRYPVGGWEESIAAPEGVASPKVNVYREKSNQ
jgi:hypothetical protein